MIIIIYYQIKTPISFLDKSKDQTPPIYCVCFYNDYIININCHQTVTSGPFFNNLLAHI